MRGGSTACSTSSTSSPMSVWPSGSIEGSGRQMSSMFCQTCSFFAAYRRMFDPTTGPNLSPKPCGTGLAPWVPGQPISSREARGRTASSSRSTRDCAMNCSTARSSTRSPRPEPSSKAGGGSTTPNARMDRWATSRLLPKSSSRQTPRGRLRHPDRLRRPRWPYDRPCTNIPTGPLDGGRSVLPRPGASVELLVFPQPVPSRQGPAKRPLESCAARSQPPPDAVRQSLTQ